MFWNKAIKIRELKCEVDYLRTARDRNFTSAEAANDKLRNLIERHNVVVKTGCDLSIDAERAFGFYVACIEKEHAESLAMAELTGKVEKILIDKGLLPKPKEKK